jgi:hypothetical protein
MLSAQRRRSAATALKSRKPRRPGFQLAGQVSRSHPLASAPRRAAEVTIMARLIDVVTSVAR